MTRRPLYDVRVGDGPEDANSIFLPAADGKFQVADELSSSLPRSGHCSPSSIFLSSPPFHQFLISNHLSSLSLSNNDRLNCARIHLFTIYIVLRWCDYIFLNV